MNVSSGRRFGAVLAGLAVIVPVGTQPPGPVPSSGVDQLRDLAELHERGQLSDEEFAAAKRRLLGL